VARVALLAGIPPTPADNKRISMKVTANQLHRLIKEELSLFVEGCGEVAETGHECPDCAAGHGCGCDDESLGDFENLNQTNISPDEAFSSGCSVCGGEHETHDHQHGVITGVDGGEPDLDGDGFGPDDRLLSKDESLRVVAAIAQNTSCPVTRNALMGVVDDLSSGSGEEWDISSSDAFGSGVAAGSEERDMFSYSGELPASASDSADLGYRVGMMGLDDENRSGG